MSFALPLLIAVQTYVPNPGVLLTEGPVTDENSVLVAMAATPLNADDAWRFSTEPQLGGTAIVVEGKKESDGTATVQIRQFSGHPRSGWNGLGGWRFSIRAKEYSKLTGQIDKLLPDPPPSESEGSWVCMDGPGLLVERATQGRSLWRSGSCGPNHPNTQIAKVIKAFVQRKVGMADTKNAFRFLQRQ